MLCNRSPRRWATVCFSLFLLTLASTGLTGAARASVMLDDASPAQAAQSASAASPTGAPVIVSVPFERTERGELLPNPEAVKALLEEAARNPGDLLAIRPAGNLAGFDRGPATGQGSVAPVTPSATDVVSPERSTLDEGSAALLRIIDSLRQVSPQTRVSVVGLPIERSSFADAAAADGGAYARLLGDLDAFVSTRGLLQGHDNLDERAWLKSAMPSAVRFAQGRPILYRTPDGWQQRSMPIESFKGPEDASAADWIESDRTPDVARATRIPEYSESPLDEPGLSATGTVEASWARRAAESGRSALQSPPFSDRPDRFEALSDPDGAVDPPLADSLADTRASDSGGTILDERAIADPGVIAGDEPSSAIERETSGGGATAPTSRSLAIVPRAVRTFAPVAIGGDLLDPRSFHSATRSESPAATPASVFTGSSASRGGAPSIRSGAAPSSSRSTSSGSAVAAIAPPAPSPPLQRLPELPTWEPDDHQLVIPITPADSLSPTAPRFVAPRPEFATDMDGWTDFTPLLESDSRIMYVAADGNDSTALVYAPHDAQIGDDPMHPVGSVRAFNTFQAARSRMRNFKADWILFRRGDVFTLPHGIYSHGTNPFFRHEPDGPSIRKVFGAYGPVSEPRPIILSSSNRLIHGFAVADRQHANSAFVSLDLRAAGVQSDDGTVMAVYGARNLHFEDCRLRGGNLAIPYKWSGDPNTRYPGGIVLRRCVVVDAARASGGHIQGLFLDGVEGCILEECVFDRNGYIEDPTDPSTWTAKLRTDNRATDPMPSGDGVQPHRTWFSRNLYLSSYSDLYIRGCILSRSASSHQMRVGGVAERNVFIWNDQALAPKTQGGRDWLHSQSLQSNLVLHEDHLLAQALQQGGLTASVGSGHEALVHDNIVTGFNRAANYAFAAVGIESYKSYPSQIGERVTFTDNVAIADRGTLWMIRGTTGVWGNGYRTIEGSGNIGVLTSAGIQSSTTETIAGNSWRLSANQFFGGAFRIGDPTVRRVGDLRFYQDLGFESGSISYHDVVALAEAAGWRTQSDAQGRRGWERDIVSYMQSIDSNYVADENVTVDDGVPLGNRRSNAPQVWRLLAGLHPACNVEPMPEEQAKLTARRYHAFLTFIERARANRKGAWDPAYTADSLNNYLRAGLGKPPVVGAYTAMLGR